MRYLDSLGRAQLSFEDDVECYTQQIAAAQDSAPFADRCGLVASTLQAGDSLPPFEQCLSTPYQCIPERVGLAATAWAICAETGFNPLAPDITPAIQACKTPMAWLLSWPAHFVGLGLEETPDLTPPVLWKPVQTTPVTEGEAFVVHVAPATTPRFYRLSGGG